MKEILENLQEFKEKEELKTGDNNNKIIDVIYYGMLTVSKNDADPTNEKQKQLFLVQKEVNGKMQYEFHTEDGIIAKVGENDEIIIEEKYSKLINGIEFLLQLQKTMPLSLKKLQELQTKSNPKNDEKENPEFENKNSKKDIQVDLDKKITETKTFAQLVPEVKEKNIKQVKIRRIDATKFEFYGIGEDGQEVEINSLKQTEGTNPNKDIVEVNKDGSQVKQDKVLTMIKIQNGTNEGKQNEGFTIKLGEYGIPEINYYRRSKEENKYTSIPVNLKDTNQKQTQLEVKQYIEKKRNPTVDDNIEKAEENIERNSDENTVLENIDDDKNNDKQTQIEKAAKRCKVTIEAFRKEYEKSEADSIEQKIEEAEERINEEYIGNIERTTPKL